MHEFSSIWIRLTLAGVIGRGFVVKMVEGEHLWDDRDKTRIDRAARVLRCGASGARWGEQRRLSRASFSACPPFPTPRFAPASMLPARSMREFAARRFLLHILNAHHGPFIPVVLSPSLASVPPACPSSSRSPSAAAPAQHPHSSSLV